MRNCLLTKRETEVMEQFWSSSEPLTSKQLLELFKDKGISAYIFNIIRSLRQKGLITQHREIKYKTQYMWEYIPTCSKEEYYVLLAYMNDVDRSEFIKQAVLRTVEDCPEEKESLIQLIVSFSNDQSNKTNNR